MNKAKLRTEIIFEIDILIILLFCLSISMSFMFPPVLWSIRYHASCVIGAIFLLGSIETVEIIYMDIKKYRGE